MKKLTLLLLLFSCSILFSQETIVTKLGDFTTLKVFSGLKIELQKAVISKVEISGSKADQVSIKNKNGTLKISLKLLEGFNYDDVNIVLYYSNPMDVIDANEGSYITSDNMLKQQHLELRVQEGAQIKLNLNIKYLTVKTVSGGIIDVAGTTQNQTIEATTGGIYKAFDLESVQARISSSSGAKADVYVTEMLDAKVNFGGSIYYKGNPEELLTKKVIGGTIKSRN
jgi:hypothetical protein